MKVSPQDRLSCFPALNSESSHTYSVLLPQAAGQDTALISNQDHGETDVATQRAHSHITQEPDFLEIVRRYVANLANRMGLSSLALERVLLALILWMIVC